jgi:hypothetical protein
MKRQELWSGSSPRCLLAGTRQRPPPNPRRTVAEAMTGRFANRAAGLCGSISWTRNTGPVETAKSASTGTSPCDVTYTTSEGSFRSRARA